MSTFNTESVLQKQESERLLLRSLELTSSIMQQLSTAPGIHAVCPLKPDTNADIPCVKALFVFERDMRSAHEFIVQTWRIAAKPKAFVNKDDTLSLREAAQELGCVITEANTSTAQFVEYTVESNLYSQPLKISIRLCSAFDVLWDTIQQESSRIADSSSDLSSQLLKRMIDDGRYAFTLLCRHKPGPTPRVEPSVDRVAEVHTDAAGSTKPKNETQPPKATPAIVDDTSSFYIPTDTVERTRTIEVKRPTPTASAETVTLPPSSPSSGQPVKPEISVTINTEEAKTTVLRPSDLSATISVPRSKIIDTTKPKGN